jgi:hypothetical protein
MESDYIELAELSDVLKQAPDQLSKAKAWKSIARILTKIAKLKPTTSGGNNE